MCRSFLAYSHPYFVELLEQSWIRPIPTDRGSDVGWTEALNGSEVATKRLRRLLGFLEMAPREEKLPFEIFNRWNKHRIVLSYLRCRLLNVDHMELLGCARDLYSLTTKLQMRPVLNQLQMFRNLGFAGIWSCFFDPDWNYLRLKFLKAAQQTFLFLSVLTPNSF